MWQTSKAGPKAAVWTHCYGAQGVWEKDEIRKDDSFTTFEEIFELAIHQKVYVLSALCTGTAADSSLAVMACLSAVKAGLPVPRHVIDSACQPVMQGCAHGWACGCWSAPGQGGPLRKLTDDA